MIAVDTNVLIYAHREDSPWHAAALEALTGLAEGRSAWAIPWPCLHEFLAIVTHPRIHRPPTPLAIAIDQVSAWLESPTLVRLGENESVLGRAAGVPVGGACRRTAGARRSGRGPVPGARGA